MRNPKVAKAWLIGLVALAGIVAVACGGAAEPAATPEPTAAIQAAGNQRTGVHPNCSASPDPSPGRDSLGSGQHYPGHS